MGLECPIAFFGLTVHPTNVITSCMLSENPLANVNEKDGIDNQNFQDLRQAMIDGKWTKHNCESCMVQEQKGVFSDRQKWLQKAKGPMEHYRMGFELTGNPIVHLNINLNNVCNFKCRMCGPKYSNAWIPDAKYLKSEDKLLVRDWEDHEAKQFVDYFKLLDLYGDRMRLQSVWVTGGEPFIDNQIFGILGQLKSYSPAKYISLNITTNGSKINFDKIEELYEFKEVCINVSVDATGSLFSYMRSAGVFDFDNLCENIEALKNLKMKNLKIQVNGSHQLYNSLNLYDFYKTFTKDIPVDDIQMRTLSHPKHLSSCILPDNIKPYAIEQAQKVLDDPFTNVHARTRLDLNNVIKNIKYQASDRDFLWHRFVKFTNLIDKRRQHYIKDEVPELWENM